MVNRLKQVLVESFIGAIALGYLLAQAVLYFVRVFDSPVAAWATRNLYRGLVPDTTAFSNLPLQAALSPAIAFVLLLLVWYLLLRWLYFTPLKKRESVPNPEQTS
jgi:hypothetical protein